MIKDIKLNLDKEKKYVVACSFGPDSMALLAMLLKKGIKPIVCHVDYHTRDVSQYEEDSLREYCRQNNLVFECLDARQIKKEGNFEAWARTVRYMFFKQIYVKYDAACLFVGHQQDDLLETYVLQKDRNSVVARYGLKRETFYEGMKVVRPLLVYTKQDLLDYCNENHIPYSIDVTNFETKLQRNKIRHEIVSKMSAAERDQMLDEISKENKELEQMEQKLDEQFEIGDELDIRAILALENREFANVIRKFVNKNGNVYKLSNGQITTIRQMCLSQQPNNSLKLDDNYSLLKEYDVLVIGDNEDPKPYSFVMDKPGVYDTEFIFVDFTNGAGDRNIYADAYPITVRSPQEGDEAIVGGNLCSLRRLFIDWKMPLRMRKIWPVFVNKNGRIIYVPRYRKNFQEYHSSILKIKY